MMGGGLVVGIFAAALGNQIGRGDGKTVGTTVVGSEQFP